MNRWTLFVTNVLFRRQERADRRTVLLGDRLLDAIKRRWGT